MFLSTGLKTRPSAAPLERGRLGSWMELTPAQAAVLERFLKAGFKFVTLEHVERYLAIEKDGFVALLDPSDDRLNLFGQAGYRMGRGIGMLVESRAGKSFVWKSESVPATPQLVAAYEEFKAEVRGLLQPSRQ